MFEFKKLVGSTISSKLGKESTVITKNLIS